MEQHAFISIALLKYDRNLSDSREKLVPEEVSEENFWRNYYYQIELIKAEFGVPTRLGPKIEEAQRKSKLAQEIEALEDPPMALNTQARNQQVAVEEADDEYEEKQMQPRLN